LIVAGEVAALVLGVGAAVHRRLHQIAAKASASSRLANCFHSSPLRTLHRAQPFACLQRRATGFPLIATNQKVRLAVRVSLVRVICCIPWGCVVGWYEADRLAGVAGVFVPL